MIGYGADNVIVTVKVIVIDKMMIVVDKKIYEIYEI